LGPSWAGLSSGPHGPTEGRNLGPSWAGLKFGPSWAHKVPKLRPIMGGAQVKALMGQWGAQTWAHHGRGSSLGLHGHTGGPNLDPSWAGLKFGPWGAQTWAHHGRGLSLGPHGPMGGPNLGPSWWGSSSGPHGPMGGRNLGPSWAGLKFGPSWAYRVPKLRPIMGGAQVWALMGQWGAHTWAHHVRGSSLGPHGHMGGPILGPSWAGLKFGPS
jgi:hypothetical protein